MLCSWNRSSKSICMLRTWIFKLMLKSCHLLSVGLPIRRNTWRHILEGSNAHSRHCDNMKSWRHWEYFRIKCGRNVDIGEEVKINCTQLHTEKLNNLYYALFIVGRIKSWRVKGCSYMQFMKAQKINMEISLSLKRLSGNYRCRRA